MSKNILQNEDTYTLSDFQKQQLADSYKKLYTKTIYENEKSENEK